MVLLTVRFLSELALFIGLAVVGYGVAAAVLAVGSVAVAFLVRRYATGA